MSCGCTMVEVAPGKSCYGLLSGRGQPSNRKPPAHGLSPGPCSRYRGQFLSRIRAGRLCTIPMDSCPCTPGCLAAKTPQQMAQTRKNAILLTKTTRPPPPCSSRFRGVAVTRLLHKRRASPPANDTSSGLATDGTTKKQQSRPTTTHLHPPRRRRLRTPWRGCGSGRWRLAFW